MTNEELAVAVQNGQPELMEQLWKQCRRFIGQQALKWAKAWKNRSYFDMDDLTQAGYIALCEAVKGYQADRGSFLTFLGFHLKTEFSKVVGCRTEAQLKDPLNEAVSLDAPAYNDEDSAVTIGETLPFDDPGFENVERDLMNEHLAQVLGWALQGLPEKQRTVIDLYYLHGLNHAQIAEVLRCSQSFPQQCVKEGFRNIRKGTFAPALSELLYGDRNYYKHTSFYSWKRTGCSSPEWELIQREEDFRWKNIRYCVNKLGMSMDQAKRLFPA